MDIPIYKKVLEELGKKKVAQLSDLKTNFGTTLKDITEVGDAQKNPRIGCFAGDFESYSVFREFFDKVIEYYHGVNPQKPFVKDWDINKLNFDNNLFKDSRIESTRVRVARNLVGFPFEMKMSLEQRLEVEEKILQVTKKFPKKFQGQYYSLEKLSESEKDKFRKKHLLYAYPEEFMFKCGLANDWPKARGIYVSKDERFSIWINEEDHLRIISMEKGGDVESVFARLKEAVDFFQSELEFTFDERLGYVNTCPTNIGTAMRASTLIHLPKLSANPDLRKFCFHFGVDVRGQFGEASNHEKTEIFDISNSKRLGVSGVEVINALGQGLERILKIEDLY